MRIGTEVKIVGGVLGMLLVLLAFLMYENTAEMRHGNRLYEELIELEADDPKNALIQEYDRLTLECIEPPVIESNDRFVRDLCDITLPALREELQGIGR